MFTSCTYTYVRRGWVADTTRASKLQFFLFRFLFFFFNASSSSQGGFFCALCAMQLRAWFLLLLQWLFLLSLSRISMQLLLESKLVLNAYSFCSVSTSSSVCTIAPLGTLSSHPYLFLICPLSGEYLSLSFSLFLLLVLVFSKYISRGPSPGPQTLHWRRGFG